MAYFYLDDSKHHAYGFSLAAFAICQDDPTEEVAQIFRTRGFDPATFEFKSSSRMAGNEKLQHLRNDLKQFIQWNCRIAVCVVKDDRTLGPAALKLLATALCHPILAGVKHNVVFDEGLFPQKRPPKPLCRRTPASEMLISHSNKIQSKNSGFRLQTLSLTHVQSCSAKPCQRGRSRSFGMTLKIKRTMVWKFRWSSRCGRVSALHS